MLKVEILKQNHGKDFEGFEVLMKKFIVDIYIRNRQEFMNYKGAHKHELVEKAYEEYCGNSPLNILSESDIKKINKKIEYQMRLFNKTIDMDPSEKIQGRYYLLKDEERAVAFQQAEVWSASEVVAGVRYLAYTDSKYVQFGKQDIIDSFGNQQYELCSEILYNDISKWFTSSGVGYEKTSTGKYMIQNTMTYMMFKGFFPYRLDDRNIHFEMHYDNVVDKKVRKKFLELYIENINRKEPKNLERIVEEVKSVPEFKELNNDYLKCVVRCLVNDVDKIENNKSNKKNSDEAPNNEEVNR